MSESREESTVSDADAPGHRGVRAIWHGGYRCDVEAGRHVIPVDEPHHVGGTDEGPQPTDLLLAAIASCFTLAISHSASKRSIDVGAISVEVVGRYEGPRFAAFSVHAEVDCPAEDLDRLIRAAERVCYVTNTLRGDPPIEVNAVASGTRGG